MLTAHRLQSIKSPISRPRPLLPISVFVIGLTDYLITLVPDLLRGGGDSAAFQTRADTGEGIQGSAVGHSLWHRSLTIVIGLIVIALPPIVNVIPKQVSTILKLRRRSPPCQPIH